MKRDQKAEDLLRAYFRERIREERSDRKQKPVRPLPAVLAQHAYTRRPAKGKAQLEALKSVFMAAACLAALASATLATPRKSYDAGVLHSAAQQLKAQADKINLFAPFVP